MKGYDTDGDEVGKPHEVGRVTTQLHFFGELPRFGQKHITMILSCPYVKLLDLTDALMFTKREPTPFSSSSKEGPIVIQYMH